MKKYSLIILLAISNFGFAGSFNCSGAVKAIAFGPASGVLQVDAGYGMHYLCSFKEEINGVDPDVCRALYTMFLEAQDSGRPVEQYYSDADGDDCSTIGSWQTPSPFPYFIRLAN